MNVQPLKKEKHFLCNSLLRRKIFIYCGKIDGVKKLTKGGCIYSSELTKFYTPLFFLRAEMQWPNKSSVIKMPAAKSRLFLESALRQVGACLFVSVSCLSETFRKLANTFTPSLESRCELVKKKHVTQHEDDSLHAALANSTDLQASYSLEEQ